MTFSILHVLRSDQIPLCIVCVIYFNRYIDALRYGTYVESSKSEMINTAQ